jgi:hypothetical protein
VHTNTHGRFSAFAFDAIGPLSESYSPKETPAPVRLAIGTGIAHDRRSQSLNLTSIPASLRSAN